MPPANFPPAADQAGQATSQINLTMQQVASGTSNQSEAASRTAHAMERMSQNVENVAQGAQGTEAHRGKNRDSGR